MKPLLCLMLLVLPAFSAAFVFAENSAGYDIGGSWTIEAKSTIGTWDHDYKIVQTGSTFSATGSPTSGNPPVNEKITGTIDVNTGALTWHGVYYDLNDVATGYTFDVTAQIDSSGGISGSFSDNKGVSGTITSISGQAVVPQPQPTNNPPTTSTETFEVQMQVGTVQIKVAGSSDWVPTKIGMVLHPGDSVRTVGNSQDNIVKLYHTAEAISSSDKVVLIRGDSTVELKSYKSEHPSAPDTDLVTEMVIDAGEVVFGTGPSGVHPVPARFLVGTPDAKVNDIHTMFEVMVTNAGTTVNVMEGTVQVSDLNGTNTVNVSANQTSTVSAGGVPTAPTSFDPSTVDHWWTTLLTSASNLPSPSPSVPEMTPAIALAALIIVSFTVILSRKKRR